MDKIYVGQTVYRKKTDYRGGWSGEVSECQVERIGKKYFYLKNDNGSPISLNTLRYESNYSSLSFRVYLSKQEILDEVETSNLISSIRKTFDYYGSVDLPLSALREIQSIIDKHKNNEQTIQLARP